LSLFSKLFPKEAAYEATAGYIKTLTGYQPVFRTFGGGIYESELCRASIHSIATHCSKLKPVVSGARKDLQTILEFQPNPYMDTSKFLYKTATILETENTAFIIPIYDAYYTKIVGFYPVQPSQAEIRERGKKEYLVFHFANGQRAAMYRENVGVLTKFFYKHDFFGENNAALSTTLDLLYTQQQGIKEGINQGATIRFLGKLGSALKPSDIEAERKRWVASNLDISNNGGIALFDTKYSDVKQVNSTPYLIDSNQIKTVQASVFSYFGVNEKILENNFTSEEWAAFYEAKVEPFALQLSLVLSNMLYTPEQKVRGNNIQFTANRLQYASTSEKLDVAEKLLDRGVLSRNEAREIFNMEPIEDGDDYIIRGEYWNASDKIAQESEENDGDDK